MRSPIARLDDGGDGDSYLASVSDLMSGLLFLFIITIMVFALSLRHEQKQFETAANRKEQELRKLKGVKEMRDELLTDLEARLKEQGVAVAIDLEQGVLRLPEEILFLLGSAEFVPGGPQKLLILSGVLAKILPCYSGPTDALIPIYCTGNRYSARVDAVFIEGHTDDLPIRGRFGNNWYLSAARAIRTFEAMNDANETLTSLVNPSGQPVLSVSGYADTRRVDMGTDAEARARNRRIDMRFIMAPPSDTPNPPSNDVLEEYGS